MPHIDDGTLHALLDGALRAEDAAAAHAAEAHLERCADCRDRLDAGAQSRRQVNEILGAIGTGTAATGAAGDFEEVLARAAALSGSSFAQHGTDALDTDRDRLEPGARARRVRRTRAVAWAATIVIAVGTGWMIRDRLGPESPSGDAVSMPTIEAEAEPSQRAESPRRVESRQRAEAGGAVADEAPPASPTSEASVASAPRPGEAAGTAVAGVTETPRESGEVAGTAEALRVEGSAILAQRAEGPLGSPAPGAAPVAVDVAGSAAIPLEESPIQPLARSARVRTIPSITPSAIPTADARARALVQSRAAPARSLEAAAAVIRYTMEHGLGRWEDRSPEVLCVSTTAGPLTAGSLDDLRALLGDHAPALASAEECELHGSAEPPLAPRLRHLPTLRSALILRLGSVEPLVARGMSATLQVPVVWEAGPHYGETLQCELERSDGRWEVSTCRR